MIKMSGENYHAKLKEADDSPSNPDIMPISPPSHVLDIQDSMEESEGEEGNTICEAAVRLIK